MKNLLVIALMLISNLAHAANIYSDNIRNIMQQEKDIVKMVYQIKIIYQASAKFSNLSNELFESAYIGSSIPLENYNAKKDNLNNFLLTTRNNDKTAVIKHLNKDCSNRSTIEKILNDKGLLNLRDEVVCENNNIVILLNIQK